MRLVSGLGRLLTPPNYNVLPFPCLTIALPGFTIFPKCSVIHNGFYSPKHNLLAAMSSRKWHYHLHGVSSPYGLFVCYQLTLTVVLSLIFHVLSVPNMTVVAHCTLPSHPPIDHVHLALLMVRAIPLRLTSSDDGSAYLLEITGSV
jgi:hypothetical protein